MWRGEVERLRRKRAVRLVTGTVVGGVVVPDLELPEGARVTVSLGAGAEEEAPPPPPSPVQRRALWERALECCDLP